MIRRSPSQTRGSFTTLSNATLCDTRLSWEARGLLAYLLSKPDNWVVNVKHLMNESPSAGRDKIYSMLKELEALGYLTQERHRDESGHWAETERVVHEIPVGNPDTAYGFAVSGSPVSGSAVSGKGGDIVNNEVKQVLNVPSTEQSYSSSALVATPQSDASGLSVAFLSSPFKDEAYALCTLLVDLMASNGMKCPKNPHAKRWLESMDQIMRIDGHAPEEVERVLRWSQASPFWHTNILSPYKFREKFPTLQGQSRSKPQQPRGFEGVRGFLEGVM